MSLRKTAGLLAAFGLMVGLIGGGIGASFLDQVTGTENISVGTFACQIIDPSDGDIALDGKSVTFTAPTIESSAPGDAPFSFTVQNTGSIDQVLTVAMTGQTGNLGGDFSAMPASPSLVALAAGDSQAISTGIEWTELVSDDLGRSGSMTWTVNCNEAAAPALPENTYVFNSTNDDNKAGTTPGHVGDGQHAYVDAVPGDGTVTLTFYNPDAPMYNCFEWRTDGDVPEQRLVADENSVGPPFADSMLTQFGVPGINDGLYKYVCPDHSGYGTPGAANPNPTTITVPVLQYVEVRMTFGGEADYRFDWTRFDALP